MQYQYFEKWGHTTQEPISTLKTYTVLIIPRLLRIMQVQWALFNGATNIGAF